MPFCSAIECKKRTGSKSDFSENKVSFHRLPSHNRSQWIHRIRRENIKDLKELRICSDHFEVSMISSIQIRHGAKNRFPYWFKISK